MQEKSGFDFTLARKLVSGNDDVIKGRLQGMMGIQVSP